MTVMKPLGLDYADPATSNHDATRHVHTGNLSRISGMGLLPGPTSGPARLPRILCAMVLVLADLCAFVASIVAAGWLVGPILLIRHAGSLMLLPAGATPGAPVHTGFFIDSVLLLGMLIACARRGHY